MPNRREFVQLRAIIGKNSNVRPIRNLHWWWHRATDVWFFSSTTPSGNVTSTQMIMSLGCGTVNLVGGFGSASAAAAIVDVKKTLPGRMLNGVEPLVKVSWYSVTCHPLCYRTEGVGHG